jgi:hypothetical protein
MFVFAMRTRGASVCDLKMPTGFPDCTSGVSSSLSSRRLLRIAA